MPLKISVDEKMPGVFRVQLSGILDTGTYKELDAKISELVLKKPDSIVFDMASLEFISSMGVRSVQKTGKMLRDFDGKMLMVNVPPHIKEVFHIIKAMPAEDIFENVEEMDSYLIRRQKKIKAKESGFED
ncbi:MAG: STAS domain-containing protein [Firmicutes bacterium]|nr:STAS domain-containing protein [Bacillota bacterium]